MQSNNKEFTNSAPWYKKDDNARFQSRVDRIHKMRDPGTFADEILSGSNILLTLSLLFTAALCFFSYKFYLERFLDPTVAIIAAVMITVLIEYGKKRIGMAALRMPFMQGWKFITSTQENTVMFIGVAFFSVVIFLISIFNSTNGSSKYAEQTARAKTETAFVPDTKDIDGQIKLLQDNVTGAPKARWKGREYYQDPKSVRQAQTSIASLQRQREVALQTQRADFERTRGNNDDTNHHSAEIALRIGGWLELVQIILMIIMASCERVLDRRSGNSNTTSNRPGQIGFNNSFQPTSHTDPNQFNSRIGFKTYESPNNTVPQPPQTVAQPLPVLSGKEADAAIRYWLNLIKKEPSNFSRSDAAPESVARRITQALDGMVSTLSKVSTCSTQTFSAVRDYLEQTALPVMAEKGFSYDTRTLYGLFYQKAKA